MSHIATTWAWQQAIGNPIRKLILLHVADSANPDNDWATWHSFRTIAAACNCSISSVSLHMKWLCENEYLSLVRQGRARGQTNKYRLNVGSVDVQIGPKNRSTNEQLTQNNRSTVEQSTNANRSTVSDHRSTVEQNRSTVIDHRSTVRDKTVKETVTEPIKRQEQEKSSSSFSWIKHLAEQFGYRPDLFGQREIKYFADWNLLGVDPSEFLEAHRIAVVAKNTDTPPIGYINGIVNNARLDATPKLVPKPKPKPSRQVESTDVLDAPGATEAYEKAHAEKMEKQLAAAGVNA